MARFRHRFESPRSAQTLAEGLAEYFAANPPLKRDEDLVSAEARQFFRSHDAVHVVYGCGTSMPDEAVVKLASLFGTTGGVGILRGYAHFETLDVYRKLPVRSTVAALLGAPWLIARTLWRCGRQARRWPWVGHDELDPETATGLVEPMRTEDDYQRRGLARHVLTAGIKRLAEVGAERIKICFRPDDPAAKGLYLSVGFEPVKQTVIFSRQVGARVDAT